MKTERQKPAETPAYTVVLGAREAALALSISVRSLRRCAAAGQLPRPYHIGGRTVWSLQQLRDFDRARSAEANVGNPAVVTKAKAGDA